MNTTRPARFAQAATRFWSGGDNPLMVRGASSGRTRAPNIRFGRRRAGAFTGSASMLSIGVASALWLP